MDAEMSTTTTASTTHTYLRQRGVRTSSSYARDHLHTRACAHVPLHLHVTFTTHAIPACPSSLAHPIVIPYILLHRCSHAYTVRLFCVSRIFCPDCAEFTKPRPSSHPAGAAPCVLRMCILRSHVVKVPFSKTLLAGKTQQQ